MIGHSLEGETYRDFTVMCETYRSRGAKANPYPKPVTVVNYLWVCNQCGYNHISAHNYFDPRPAMDRHMENGHTACEYCGEVLRNCLDGSPRRHRWDKCPGKDESFRVVRAYELQVSEVSS